jgi:hypothetical protein
LIFSLYLFLWWSNFFAEGSAAIWRKFACISSLYYTISTSNFFTIITFLATSHDGVSACSRTIRYFIQCSCTSITNVRFACNRTSRSLSVIANFWEYPFTISTYWRTSWDSSSEAYTSISGIKSLTIQATCFLPIITGFGRCPKTIST